MLERPLPTYNFKFLSQYDIDRLDIMNIEEDSDTGYILVVDLEVPDENHDLYDQFPLCPENVLIDPDHVSEYTKTWPLHVISTCDQRGSCV